jgi:hypothetical protein
MTPQEQQKVEAFISINDKVINSKFRRETKTVSFNLNFEEGKPLEQEVAGFDEDALRSMLIDLRKFTLDRDDVNLIDICNLLITNTTDAETITNLEKCKSIFSQLKQEPPIRMVIDNEIETGWDVIRKWLYGHYFHEKQERDNLKKLGVVEKIHKYNFVVTITELISLCNTVANNAKIVLNK